MIVVVGAGPAGMHAARAAAACGAEVLLVDSAPSAGGQYHRQPLDRPKTVPGVRHLPSTSVWAVEGRRVYLRSGQADGPGRRGRVVDAGAIVLATGAFDRALPFPGWDLPGVFTAGAAQAMAKGQRVAVGKRVLVAGTGPFLLPVAESLTGVGARVVGVLEANSPAGWLRDPAGLLAGASKAGELAGYVTTLVRHRIPYRPRTAVLAAHGDERVSAVTVGRLDKEWNVLAEERVEVDAVCVGHGFTPQLELAYAVGCAIRDGFVTVNIRQETSVPGIFAAGEITGIGGAALAAAEGTVAGTAAAYGDPPVAALRRVRAGRTFAAALARAYPIRQGWQNWLTGDTVICRCERVPLSEVRSAVADRDATAARALRLVSRVGLGLCQGRVCGRTVAELTGVPVTDRRPIAVPLRLAELAEEEE